MFPITQTAQQNFEVFNLHMAFKKVMDDFYFRTARVYRWWRPVENLSRIFIRFWLREQEKKVLEHPVGKKMFEIWLANIYGRKTGIYIDRDAQIEFLNDLFKLLDIQHHPKYQDIFNSYQDLFLGIRIMRRGIFSHMYLSFPFVMRRDKKVIKHYFEMAAILGEYEMVLKRYPPYHRLMTINTPPGMRTMLDPRGFDVAIVYLLTFRYSVGLELDNIPTRNNARFITCPIVEDDDLTAEHKAEIEKIEQEIKFREPPKLSNVRFEDGKVFSGDEEIKFWGPKRQMFTELQAEVNQRKSCFPPPGPQSGIVIRFNLLQPMSALLNGINRRREVSLDEIMLLAQVFDVVQPEWGKPDGERKPVGKIIDEVYEGKANIKEGTRQFMSDIQALRLEDPSERKAWEYVIGCLLDGKNNPVSNAIQSLLISDVMELGFSLWALITGREITVNYETGEYEERAVSTRKKQAMPLVDRLKSELEDLLKTVFTRHLEISAATNRDRSEPVLAGMIVAHCLNVHGDPEKFRENLQSHLLRHYDIHFRFLDEYLQGAPQEILRTIFLPIVDEDTGPPPDGVPEVIQRRMMRKKIAEFRKKKVPGIVDRDVEGIVALVERTRSRLYSPGVSYRLLCYIDPDSVEVQLGNFEYDGMGLIHEEQFLKDHQARQYELAEIESVKRRQVEEEFIKRRGNKEIAELEKIRLRVQADLKRTEIETQKSINDAEMERITGEAKRRAIEKLKDGDLRSYAVYALVEAFQSGGFKEVEELLKRSPHILGGVNPDLFKIMKTHELRMALADAIKQDPTQINAVTAAVLMNIDLRDVAAADIYKDVNKSVFDILKNLRLGMPPYGPLFNVNSNSVGGGADGTGEKDGKRESERSEERAFPPGLPPPLDERSAGEPPPGGPEPPPGSGPMPPGGGGGTGGGASADDGEPGKTETPGGGTGQPGT